MCLLLSVSYCNQFLPVPKWPKPKNVLGDIRVHGHDRKPVRMVGLVQGRESSPDQHAAAEQHQGCLC